MWAVPSDGRDSSLAIASNPTRTAMSHAFLRHQECRRSQLRQSLHLSVRLRETRFRLRAVIEEI